MKTSDFDFELPPGLIAATPAPRRDESRLCVLDPSTGACIESRFSEIGQWLRPGDLLVANNSRVFPARLWGHRHGTGGKVEMLLLEQESASDWLCLCRPAAKLKPGERVVIGDGRMRAEVLSHRGPGERLIRFEWEGDWRETLEQIGETPLPPYILGARKEHPELGDLRASDRDRYQTVYADTPGSVAAPTAGLHFTPELIDSLRAQGIGWAEVTLHVGMGTFQPVNSEVVEEHRMHSERFTISEATAHAINETRDRGGRIIAVGTTSTRVLESVADEHGRVRTQSGSTRIFITPGHRFRAVDGLITNFHLPRSTLLMLVSALAGREHVLAAYAWAIDRRFRFYSYGDAMLILPGGQGG